MPTTSNSMPWIVWTFLCCWPSPVAMGLVALVVTAIHKQWVHINLKVDTKKIPKLNWRRNQ